MDLLNRFLYFYISKWTLPMTSFNGLYFCCKSINGLSDLEDILFKLLVNGKIKLEV